MRVLKLLIAGALFGFANLALATAVSCTNLYPEGDDASDRSSPQDVTGGPYCGISGHIGSDTIFSESGPPVHVFDEFDAFRFYYTGGHFNGEVDFSSSIAIELYHAYDLAHAIAHSGYDWGTQVAGNYVLELQALVDPPFQFGLIIDLQVNPDANPFPIRAPAPAPGVLVLMLAGLAGLAASRRRTKTV